MLKLFSLCSHCLKFNPEMKQKRVQFKKLKLLNQQTNKGVEDYYKSVSIQTADYLQQYFTIKGM